MNQFLNKQSTRQQRRRKIRARISGTAERPRASVHRSNTRVRVQLIDDAKQVTLLAAEGKPEEVGTKIAAEAKQAGITAIVFDRGGYKYHGRVKVLAETMRKAGLQF